MNRSLRADILLFLTAAIWGLAFVAQRVGMEHVGPLTFNGVRFALGAAALIPLIRKLERGRAQPSPIPNNHIVLMGCMVGVCLFAGATLQQLGLAGPLLQSMGLTPTTAGKAGFITGLYVVFVPVFGLFLHQRTDLLTWAGCVLAVVGMYLLSVTSELTMDFGDLLVLGSAVFWAMHVLLIGKVSPGMDACDAVKLSAVQFATCAVLSLVGAVGTEEITLAGLSGATLPILYGGLMSVGVAYTLQVVAQRDAQPAHAAIILCLESVFAALGGWALLDEYLSVRALIGCGLMFGGMILSQIRS